MNTFPKLSLAAALALSLITPTIAAGEAGYFRLQAQGAILWNSNDDNPGDGDNDENDGGNEPGSPVEVGRTVGFDYSLCPTDFTGDQIRSRGVISWSDGTETYGDWSDWDPGSCGTTKVQVGTYKAMKRELCDGSNPTYPGYIYGLFVADGGETTTGYEAGDFAMNRNR